MGGAISSAKDEIFGVIKEETPKYQTVEKTENFEIRQYGPAIVAETTYQGAHGTGKTQTDAFFALAGYIGAVSAPKNVKAGEGDGKKAPEAEAISMTAPVIMTDVGEKISMTAPVVMQSVGETISMTAPVVMQSVGEKIAMTAPVIMEERKGSEDKKGNQPSGDVDVPEGDLMSRTMKTYLEYTDNTTGKQQTTMAMQFILPSKYTMETVPKPLDSRVTVKEVPGKKVGAVVFSGSWSEEIYKEKAEKLKADLEAGGYKTKGTYMFAGYNSPATLPAYRRNEIWYELDS